MGESKKVGKTGNYLENENITTTSHRMDKNKFQRDQTSECKKKKKNCKSTGKKCGQTAL